MPDPIPFPTPEQITEAAARWIPRLDAGLTEDEEREFETWVEADARHAEVLERQQAVWNRFESLAHAEVAAKPDADRFAPRPVPARRRDSSWALWLAAAAAVAMGAFVWQAKWGSPVPTAVAKATVVELPPPLVQRTLPDGSVVGLNRGAEINVEYTATERRVALVRGEASFTVAKNPDVPFIVSAGGVRVRAVGTAFNVRFDPVAVEIVVSEGRVAVNQDVGPSLADVPPAPVLLEARQRTSVLLTTAAPTLEVATLSPEQLDARLAWQPRLLDFDDAPLSEIVRSFNRHNPVRLVIADQSIAALRLNASIRSDNLEGFVRLLESDFGIRMEKHGDDEIALRRVR